MAKFRTGVRAIQLVGRASESTSFNAETFWQQILDFIFWPKVLARATLISPQSSLNSVQKSEQTEIRVAPAYAWM